jgi:hypothetical protein
VEDFWRLCSQVCQILICRNRKLSYCERYLWTLAVYSYIMLSSKSFVASPLVCVGLSLILAAGCSERREAFYPSLADAISAGEINRGCIPDFLPESSRAIHIIYAPESPRTYCAFEFSPSDSQRLVRNLTNLDALRPSVKPWSDTKSCQIALPLRPRAGPVRSARATLHRYSPMEGEGRSWKRE